MKRQLGAMLVAGMLLCASLAWSQSGSAGSSQGGSTGSSQSGSTASSQSGSTGPSQGGSAGTSPSGSTSTSQTGFSSSSQTLFTNSSPTTLWTDSAQNGAGDSGQAGGSSGDNTQTGSIGPQDTFSHPETLPGLDLFSDQVSHTGISIDTSVGSLAQHVSVTGFPGYWQALSNFGAGLTITQSRPTYGWLVNYEGGLNLTTGASTYNYANLNQSANAQVTWNFAKRWQMRLKDTYFYSDNPFQPFFTFLAQPTPNNPYPVTYLPQAVIEQNMAHMDLTYELSPHDIINFTGAESFNRYLRQSITSLYDSIDYSGAAFYQHAFSERLAAGGGYQFAALDFGHGQSRAGVQTFESFIEYQFSSRISASLWVGPELTATKDIVPVFCSPYGCLVDTMHAKSWSVANGGTFDWRIGKTDRLSVQGSHGVSNAGGLLGAAEIYQLTGTYGRPLTRVWNLGIGVNYSNSSTVSEVTNITQYLRSTGGTIGVSRKVFNEAWNVNAYYAFIHQTQNYFGTPATISTSGLGFTIRYVWSHGLGR